MVGARNTQKTAREPGPAAPQPASALSIKVLHEPLGLFDTAPDRRQVRLSFAIVGLLLLASLAILPVRDVRLPEVRSFIPVVDAIMFIGELITAALLYAQASVFRSRGLAILGTCYLSTALLLISHALTFPGAFSANGLLGAKLSTPAWIYFLRNPVFIVGAIMYVELRQSDLTVQSEIERGEPKIGVYIFAAIVLAAAITILTTIGHDFLPPLLLDRTHVIQSHLAGFEVFWSAAWVIAIVIVWRRRSSVLDLWLLVALACWLLQSLFDITTSARFTAGSYWLWAMTLFSHLVLMLALTSESTRLYARLALSASALRREREARLMSMDALAAAISHEVGQPLAAVGLTRA
jgi:hypothetical protein